MQLLRGCVRSLERTGLTAFRQRPHDVRRHIIDLIAVAATARHPIGESSGSAIAATRLAGALDYITSHFSDTELRLTKVAQSLRISPRYLQRLLESSGRSFTAHVTELRLKRAFTLLTAQAGNCPYLRHRTAGWFFRYFPLQPAVPFPLGRYTE